MATPAFEHDQSAMGKRKITIDGVERPYFEQLFWAGLAVCCYLPSTIIPTGPNRDGLPIGIQIIGRPFAEEMLFRAGAAYEQATEWTDRTPEL